jgi:hypothetical protein
MHGLSPLCWDWFEKLDSKLKDGFKFNSTDWAKFLRNQTVADRFPARKLLSYILWDQRRQKRHEAIKKAIEARKLADKRSEAENVIFEQK